VGEHVGFARRVVRRPREREGTLEQRHRRIEPTGSGGQASDHAQRCRAERRLDLLQAVDLHAQVEHEIEGALRRDGLAGRAQGGDRGRRIPVRDRALARGDEIVELERQGAPARAAAVPARAAGVLGAEAGEVPAMPLLRSASPVRAARRQLLGRVFVDRQVHPEVRLLERVARLIDRHPGAQQALVDEHLDRIDDRRRVGSRTRGRARPRRHRA
jgi:hypothetical protein